MIWLRVARCWTFRLETDSVSDARRAWNGGQMRANCSTRRRPLAGSLGRSCFPSRELGTSLRLVRGLRKCRGGSPNSFASIREADLNPESAGDDGSSRTKNARPALWNELDSPALAAEFASRGTDAYRIADGEECRIERYGDGVIISHAAESPASGVLEELVEWGKRAEVVIERIYARRLVSGPGKKRAPRSVGRPSHQHTCVAHEEGLCYEIDFLAGYSCGLFLDQRANRRRLRATKAERVLNLFSYTCSFSVAAAAGGAQTLSIDISKAALDRGRRNFALNGLSLEGHRFMADDAFDVSAPARSAGRKVRRDYS